VNSATCCQYGAAIIRNSKGSYFPFLIFHFSFAIEEGEGGEIHSLSFSLRSEAGQYHLR
jgi:hypothetical protein